MRQDGHSLPVFEGAQSRRHARHTFEDLRRRADAAIAAGGGAGAVETFVQFAGFPRSGHSVVGALIDAHPDAVVAHELDAMGLVTVGFSADQLLALVRENAAAFAEAGRWWNGYRYQVPGADAEPPARPRVAGDKKGDWAVRRLAAEPELADRLSATLGARRQAWTCVLRNPFDNVATLSLRKGRAYDRLRIRHRDTSAFARALGAAQGDSVAGEVLSGTVRDYAALCDGMAALAARVSAADWLVVHHEDLIAAPEAELGRILAFLDLPDTAGFAARAAGLVAATPHRSRHDIAWPDARRAEVEALIARHGFLARYGWEA